MKQSTSLIIFTMLIIILAGLSRVFLYPLSFSPLIAMSLFGGAVLRNKALAFVAPIAALLVSDIVFEISGITKGFYGASQLVNYTLFAAITFIGIGIRSVKLRNVAIACLASCILFYLVSNTANFILSNPVYHTYPQTFSGYLENMIAGLPFLNANLISTVTYAALFFGIYKYAEQNIFVKQTAVAA